MLGRRDLTMKVTTSIHSGNLIDEASQSADQLVGEVTKFVSTANLSANDIREKATAFVNSAWSSIYGPLTSS